MRLTKINRILSDFFDSTNMFTLPATCIIISFHAHMYKNISIFASSAVFLFLKSHICIGYIFYKLLFSRSRSLGLLMQLLSIPVSSFITTVTDAEYKCSINVTDGAQVTASYDALGLLPPPPHTHSIINIISIIILSPVFLCHTI